MAPPKSKGQKMGLGEFLTDTSLGSWADEMEDAPIPSSRYGSSYGHNDRSFQSSGQSSTYQDRGYAVRESLPLPSKPPFTVHLGNMSFDATEAAIQEFFAGCEVTNVRIVEDKIDRKPRGFGYAEFGSLEGLKKALENNGAQFQGRNIRVTVAEPQKDRNDARELIDWTRKGPLPDAAPRRDTGRPAFGSGPPARSPEEQGGDRPGRRPPFEQGDGKVRDFNNWERKGPLQPPAAPTGPPAGRPTSNDGPRERKNSPAWGEGRSQDGSRPPRRDFSDRPAPERVPTAAEQDTQWRARMRPDPPVVQPASPVPPSREPSMPSSPAAPPAAAPLATRPKLNLQKRTVSTADPSPTSAVTPGDSKASPFGAARPIDTSAREKEIEEKLRLKKEQEEKAREEKRIADEKAKEERRLAVKDGEKTPTADKAGPNSNGQAEEGAVAGDGPGGKNYQILRRDGEQGSDGAAETDSAAATEGSENKAAAADAKNANGVDADGVPVVDDDGWNTVTKPQKSRKQGGRG